MDAYAQPSRPYSPPSTPPATPPEKHARSVATFPHNAPMTPPRSPKSQSTAMASAAAVDEPKTSPGEVVTVLGSYAMTNSIAEQFSERHIVNQLDSSFASHLKSPLLQTSMYVIVPSSTENLSTVLRKLTPNLQPLTTVVLYGAIPAATVRNALGPLLLKRSLKGGIVIPDSEGAIIAGLESISPNSTNSIAWICQGLLPNYQLVSSPETADCVVRFRQGRRKLMEAWEAEMRGFCEDAGANIKEVLPSANQNHRADYWQPATHDAHTDISDTADHQDWHGSIVAGAVAQMESRAAEQATQLVENVRLVKEAGGAGADSAAAGSGSDPKSITADETAKILVVGNDAAFVSELCRAEQVSVEVVQPYQTRLPNNAVRFSGEWTLETLTAFDAIAVLQEDSGLDMGLLEAADGDGVFVEWYC